MEHPKTIKAAKVGYIILSALFSVLGILVIIFPSVFSKLLCYFLGGAMIAYGIVRIIGYFSNDIYRLAFQFDLASGIISAVLGLIMIIRPDFMISFIGVIFGIFILMDGMFKIQMALDAKRFGLEYWWLIAALAVIAGVFSVIMILNPFGGANALMILVGISLLLEGVLNLCVSICAVKIKREPKDNIVL